MGRGSPWRCVGPASGRAHDRYLGFFIRVAPSSPVFFLFFTMPPLPYLQGFWTPNIIASNMSIPLNKYTGLMISYCGALWQVRLGTDTIRRKHPIARKAPCLWYRGCRGPDRNTGCRKRSRYFGTEDRTRSPNMRTREDPEETREDPEAEEEISVETEVKNKTNPGSATISRCTTRKRRTEVDK